MMQEQQAELIRLFSVEENCAAIKGLSGEGSQGPDGLLVFIDEFWDIIRTEVTATMEEIPSQNYGMEKVNRSYLVMLPKCQSTVQVGEFWPILLSTSISLRIVKVLVNRLREVIRELVGPFQSSFIRGRQLVDCAIVAREIVEWKRKGTTGLIWNVHFAKA